MAAIAAKYRALGFLAYVACVNKLQQKVVNRVREINGEFCDLSTEVFKYTLLKDFGSGLSIEDMKQFLLWFTQQSTRAVQTRDLIVGKLRELRKWRLCWIHVMCHDGRVPVENSMSPYDGPS